MTDFAALADRYVAVWNETDAEERRRQISALWAEGGHHYTPSQEAHGYEELERRVLGSHNKWVAPGQHRFVSARDAQGHHGGVRFRWLMVRLADQKVEAVGFDFLQLDADGRIVSDHQYIDPTPAV